MLEQKPVADVVRETGADLHQGLSSAEASSRLESQGPNVLVEKAGKTWIQMFLSQLNEPMIYILFAAAAISIAIGEFSDAAIVLAIVLLNAVIGVVQEGKAQQALEALKKLSSPTALVRRDGKVIELAAAELVVGDVVVLDAGRQVPADLRLTFSTNLKIEEAALTGESVPVEKDSAFVAAEGTSLGDRINMAYMTTSVSYGRGEGIVAATGMKTEIGKIAQMLSDSPDEQTPLQKRLAELGKLLGIIAIVLCVALFGIAVIQKRDILEMFITAISLAVAAVPEGLPAIVTIVLALGVQRLVKVNTIVRRLPSVETLGAVSVVCSDKTGTLTQNKMTVTQCYANLEKVEVSALDVQKNSTFVEGFLLCNDASVQSGQRLGDPTELALLDMAARFDLGREELEKAMPRINELPFDSVRKRMTTVHRIDGRVIGFTKGAPDSVLALCDTILLDGAVSPITDAHRAKVVQAIRDMSSQALRVLALAIRQGSEDAVEEGLTFVGLVGMIDPPRPEAARAVAEFKEASVRTVMITGDHVDTAFAIAKELGIATSFDECITGEQLDALSTDEIANRIESLSVFARVSPEHKVQIVTALRARGRIVSMTGDGVNDAPSLKAADIGVAMGITGTDVAKGAADMVLTDDNFATIRKAIEEGRSIYVNIKKSVMFLLSSNFGEIITMFLAILVGLAAPLKSIHILWVNLITDSLPALALGVDKNDYATIMKRPPRHPKESIFAEGGLFLTLFYGTVVGLITLGAFLLNPILDLSSTGQAITLGAIITSMEDGAMLMRSQTYAFTVLGLSQLFHAIGMRDITRSVFVMNLLENRAMIGAFVIGFLLQVMVTEVPLFINIFDTVQLGLMDWLKLAAIASTPLWLHEILVPFWRRKRHVK